MGSVRKMTHSWGFPGGSVVSKLLASVEDMGSIPGLGRSHTMEQLSQYATNTEPVLQGLEATTSKPTHREADTQQQEKAPQ